MVITSPECEARLACMRSYKLRLLCAIGKICRYSGPADREHCGWHWVQEKRIRAQQSMKQLSKRMAEQRLKTLEHLRKGMTPKGKVRPWLTEVWKSVPAADSMASVAQAGQDQCTD